MITTHPPENDVVEKASSYIIDMHENPAVSPAAVALSSSAVLSQASRDTALPRLGTKEIHGKPWS